MRVVIQRTLKSSVKVDNKIVGQIDNGLTILVGFGLNDTSKEIDYMVNKIVNLRIFNDDNGVMNKSLLDVKGDILSISQFTLYADASKGRRPSFIEACNPERAVQLYDYFNDNLRKSGLKVETGKFRAEMDVQLVNSGPITIMLDSDIIIKR